MDFIKNQILKVAKLCFEEGFVNGSSGNISYTYKNHMYITKKGSYFGDLTYKDIIRVNLRSNYIGKASSEFFVHKSIVLNTSKKAIIHTHSKYSTLASYFYKEIEPIDSEGKMFFNGALVLELEHPSASKELENTLSEMLKYKDIVIVKTHGVFVASDELMKAYNIISALEHSCFMLLESKKC